MSLIDAIGAGARAIAAGAAPKAVPTTPPVPTGKGGVVTSDGHRTGDVAAANGHGPAADAKDGAAGVGGRKATPGATKGGDAKTTGAGSTPPPPTADHTKGSSKAPAKPKSTDPHDAANLDAAVPTAKRSELLAGQAKAQKDASSAAALAHHTGDDPVAARRAVLAKYYASSPYYVDRSSGKVFAATYDGATGKLHGERTGDTLVDPHEGIDRTRDAAARADGNDMREQKRAQQQAQRDAQRAGKAAGAGAASGTGASKQGGAGGAGGAGASGSAASAERDAAAGAEHAQPLDPDAAASAGAGGSTDAAAAAAADAAAKRAAATIGGALGGFGGMSEPPVTSTIDVDPSGNSTLTQTRSSGAKDERASLTQVVHTDGSGAIVDARRETTQQQRVGTDGSRDTTHVQTWGAGGSRTGDTTDVSSTRGKQQVTHHTASTFANDEVSHVQEQWTARDDVSVASESHETDYAGGQPSHGTVERTATDLQSGWFPKTVTQKDTIEYGDDGRPKKIDSDYADDQRDAPDLLLADAHAGSSDEPFFALGRVENRPGTDDKGKFHEGSLAGPGATVRHAGILVTVEGADATDPISRDSSLYQTGPDGNANKMGAQAKFAYALDTIDHTPEELRSTTKQVRYGLQSNDGAYAWSTQNKSLVFFDGNTGSAETMWHEMAHAADGKPGAPDESTWRSAAEHDAASRETVLHGLPAGTYVQGTNPDLLDKQLGTDAYGSHGPSGGDLSRAEDWAEATSLFLQDRRDGGLATAHLPDGSTKELRFADLYPERARILTAYYHDFPGWQVPEAAPRRVDTTRFPQPKRADAGGSKTGSVGEAAGGIGGALGGLASSSATGGAVPAPGAPHAVPR